MTSPIERFTTNEAAQRVGVSKSTLLEWLRKRKVPGPRLRDRNGWRIWTEADISRVIAYRDQTQPAPERPPVERRQRVPEGVTS